jgi:hypothetical protein
MIKQHSGGKCIVPSQFYLSLLHGPRYWLTAMDGASSSAWSRTSWRRRSISSSARRFNRLSIRCSRAAITGTWEDQTNQHHHILQIWPPHHYRQSGLCVFIPIPQTTCKVRQFYGHKDFYIYCIRKVWHRSSNGINASAPNGISHPKMKITFLMRNNFAQWKRVVLA